MARRGGPVIIALNVTHLFNREMLMYAFGDIKFKKPVPLKKIAWTLIGFGIWTLPLFFLIGPPPAVWVWAIYILPPLVFGHYITKPVFGGKGLFDWGKVQIRFLQQPRGWSDLKPDNHQEDTVFFIEHEVLISRRREIAFLAKIARERSKRK